MDDHENTLQMDYDEISMKTKLIWSRFGSTFETLRFDDNSFFKILSGLTSYWDYKPSIAVHADSPGV